MDINSLTLEQKIGQLFIVAVEGHELSSEYRAHYLKHHLSNFIYFAKNLKGYQAIRSLSDSLQAVAMEACGIPAFITADQEGGMVTRAYSGATQYPSNMAIAASGMGAEATHNIGRMMGRELQSLGINLNHAPNIDVNNNPDNPVIGIRSYGDDPGHVALMGVGFIEGLQGSGVMANAKHFPGHGDTYVDSHLDLPYIGHSMERLEAVELVPFKAAIAAGVDSIMTAHIVFKAIDSELPATLSEKVLTGFLRNKMGFDGLVITDCMTMEAIRTHYGTERGCIMALNAGADLLCLCALKDGQERCYNAVLNAVKSGEISIETIDRAVARIISHKAKYKLSTPPPQPKERYQDHEAYADTISQKTITLLKDRGGLLPLSGKDVFVISPPPSRANIADDTLVFQETFCKLAAEELGCPYAEIDINPDAKEIDHVLKQAAKHDIILYASYNANLNHGQVRLFDALKAAGKPVVLISLRTPYDALRMPTADVSIAAYEYTNRAVRNSIKAITGDLDFMGKLPVRL